MQLISSIQNEINFLANYQNKDNYEKYFKGVVLFRGVKAPTLKKIFSKYRKIIKYNSLQENIDLAFGLIKSEYFEDKSIAILILEKLHKKLDLTFLSDLKQLFYHNIYDWATCDVLSSKVVCNMIKYDKNFSKYMLQRADDDYLWLKRSSCVSFVKIAKHGLHNEIIIHVCKKVIKNQERFAQLGVGWVLRELSLNDLNLVIDFIIENYSLFSREGLRYAIEKMTENNKKMLMQYK